MAGIEFTGERLIPDLSPPSLEAEHRSRYKFACAYVKNLNVLDLGCGTGYGSKILAESAKSVTGIDLSPDAINYANEKFSTGNIKFEVGDVTSIVFEKGMFDAVVCFEVIEHIENPGMLLKKVADILPESGAFIISTPNGAVKVSSQPNPFHVKEFTISEFTGLLAEYFKADLWEINIFGQFISGKKYSALSVAMKNACLTLKGALGIKTKFSLSEHMPASGKIDTKPGYVFLPDRAELAEYLVAVISPRG